MRGRISREQLAFSFDEPTAAPYTLVCDDVLRWAETYTGEKFHAALLDGPYSLGDGNKGFMSAKWDTNICFRPETWKALAQHLLPGAFILAFGSSRGWHRLACAMEDAGLRIMPSIFNWRTGETYEIGMYGWANGSSFPKASRIDTKLDAAGVNYPSLHTLQEAIRQAREAKGMTRAEVSSAVCGTPSGACWNWESGLRVPTKDHWEQLQVVLNLHSSLAETRDAAEREVVGIKTYAGPTGNDDNFGIGERTANPRKRLLEAPATPLAQIWAGHRYGGQMLKDALTPIIVAQVPYAGKPVESIVEHGSGAMNIDGGRISWASERDHQKTLYDLSYMVKSPSRAAGSDCHEGWQRPWMDGHGKQDYVKASADRIAQNSGRWPPNFVLQHVSFPVFRLKGHLPSDTKDAITRYYAGYTEVSTLREGRNGAMHHGLEVLARDIPEGWVDYFELTGEDLGCVAQGTRQVKGHAPEHLTRKPGSELGQGSGWNGHQNVETPVRPEYGDANGMEEVPAYQCHASCVVRKLDLQAGVRKTGGPGHTKAQSSHTVYDNRSAVRDWDTTGYNDTGSASRFFATMDWSLDVAERLAQADPAFYCAKASRSERDAGLSNEPQRRTQAYGEYKVRQCNVCGTRHNDSGPSTRHLACGHEDWSWVEMTQNGSRGGSSRNHHPTVKPIKLCRWLATLLLPPAAYAPRRLLNVFSGSGSEGIGAMLAGWEEIVMVDSDQSYVDISKQRLAYWSAHRGVMTV